MQKPTLPPDTINSAERRWASKLAEEAALWRSKKRQGHRTQRVAANGREIPAERIFRFGSLKPERIW